eukprot:6195227-Pleurochrysis_carterae.AAC.2
MIHDATFGCCRVASRKRRRMLAPPPCFTFLRLPLALAKTKSKIARKHAFGCTSIEINNVAQFAGGQGRPESSPC